MNIRSLGMVQTGLGEDYGSVGKHKIIISALSDSFEGHFEPPILYIFVTCR